MGDSSNNTSHVDDGPSKDTKAKTEKEMHASQMEMIHKHVLQDHYNVVLTMRSGKRISLADCGDPNGLPVMMFVGLAGTRHFAYVYEDMARDCGIRLICPDRPGTGLSDDVAHEDKTAFKWTEIMTEIADQLQIERFGLVGQSCGAVYALACALKIPHRLMGPVHLISPWVPLSTPGASRSLKVASYMPRFLISATSSVIQSMPQAAISMGSVNAMSKGWSEAERRSFLTRGLNAVFEVMFKMKKTENHAGHKNDIMLSLEKDHEHGFQYTQVNYPVCIFHGSNDGMVPVASVRWLETAMPNCKVFIQNAATHNLGCDLDYMKDTFFTSLKSGLESSF